MSSPPSYDGLEDLVRPGYPSLFTIMDRIERGELPGQVPLKEWEDGTKMNVEVNVYGWKGQHALARLHLPKDEDYEAARMALMCMVMDFKHTKAWLCEFCGEPARETQMQSVPYVWFPICRLPVYIHHVCDMDKASCQAALKEAHDRINEEHRGIMGPHPPPMSKPPGEIYPLGASCANCKTDVSAQSDMKRCGACKMTRYCGAKCQKADWPRHKVACKCVKYVMMEGFTS